MQVRVRWKDRGASEEDLAHETASSLTPDDVFLELDPDVDADFLWASAMAAFAELVKENAYGDADHVDTIAGIVEAQAERDDGRAEFAALFEAIRSQL